MLLGNCLRKCCWIVPKSMFLNCFLYEFLDFPESQCNVNRSFWPRLGHFKKACFSLSCERGPFLYLSLIFSQNLTPAHLSIHTHIIMHTLSLSDFGQNSQTEMTHSENWPKWPTYQVWTDPPPKFGWNNLRQINPGPKWPAFRSFSQFNSQQVPINEALSKFH